MESSYKEIKAEGGIHTLDVILRTARFWWITPFKFQYNSYFYGMSQNVHISSLTAPEWLGPTDFQHLSQREKAVLMHSSLPRYAKAYNKECYAKSVANFSMLSQESF